MKKNEYEAIVAGIYKDTDHNLKYFAH